MDQDPKPVRRMSDIGPRKTLDLRNSNTNAPVNNQVQAPQQPRPAQKPAPVAPAPRPAQRPVRPVAPVAAASVARQQQPAQGQRPQQSASNQRQQQPAQTQQQKPAKKKGNGWKIALQFIIGLLVIVGVAAAIVALYVKYYQ